MRIKNRFFKLILLFSALALCVSNVFSSVDTGRTLKKEPLSNNLKKESNEIILADSTAPSKTTEAETSKNQFEIIPLLKNEFPEKKDLVFSLSKNFSDDERDYLFNRYRKTTLQPFLLNWLVGFGVGSFYQGDTKGGKIALYGELGSLGGGLVIFGLGAIVDIIGRNGGSLVGGVIGACAAIVGFLVFKVYEMIRPFTYARLYNSELSESLRLSLMFSPTINIAQNGQPTYGVALSGKF